VRIKEGAKEVFTAKNAKGAKKDEDQSTAKFTKSTKGSEISD